MNRAVKEQSNCGGSSSLIACKQIGVHADTIPMKKSIDFEYKVLKIKTIWGKEKKDMGLSFFEGEHDIPFEIGRFYTIFETEQEALHGHCIRNQSWHLLFCPSGSIDVLVDTGKERRVISLSDPEIGIILSPAVWREILWKKPGSVLCVAASGHDETEDREDDYSKHLKHLRAKERSMTIESTEGMEKTIV